MAFSASSILLRSKPKLNWLDLRGSGLSAIERLCLEEVLLRHSTKCWGIVGTHEPTRNRILQTTTKIPNYINNTREEINKSCVVIMGIGGKPESLLNMDLVKEDGVLVLKRFSGGGTVVMDHSSLWTTFIGRNNALPQVEPFPRPIMKWSADCIFGPTFESLSKQARSSTSIQKKGSATLIIDAKGGSSENSGRVLSIPREDDESASSLEIPKFSLVETDYCLGERKMGGNAQAIVKGGWLHHTSFLWDYEDDHMEYLSIPSKQPDYRQNRSHDDFLVKLKTHYNSLGPNDFFATIRDSCTSEFETEQVTYKEALGLVNAQVGGLQHWFDTKCRTKIIDLEI